MWKTKAGDEADPHDPQEDGAGQDRHEELAQELAVVVEVLRAQVHLQVADGVGEHEADEQRPVMAMTHFLPTADR